MTALLIKKSQFYKLYIGNRKDPINLLSDESVMSFQCESIEEVCKVIHNLRKHLSIPFEDMWCAMTGGPGVRHLCELFKPLEETKEPYEFDLIDPELRYVEPNNIRTNKKMFSLSLKEERL